MWSLHVAQGRVFYFFYVINSYTRSQTPGTPINYVTQQVVTVNCFLIITEANSAMIYHYFEQKLWLLSPIVTIKNNS